MHKYLLQKDPYDPDDVPVTALLEPRKKLPDHMDYVSKMPPIWNQGNIGACQSYAICAIDQYIKGYKFDPSRLFTYYNVRRNMGTTDKDTGGTLRATCDAVATYGICDAKVWPNDNGKVFVEPDKAAYDNANADNDKIYTRYRVSTVYGMRMALAAGHIPLLGLRVFENFESPRTLETGDIPEPHGELLGGHALDIAAYYDEPKLFEWENGYAILRNSWGAGMGIKKSGYFKISYKVLTKLLMDCWIIVK